VWVLKITTAAILFFGKIENFNDLSTVGSQSASACQISLKSVKRLLRYGDLTVFKMATSAILDVGNKSF